ncbi:MAG: PLP-dependent cysteine synthase family protein [Vicinamibacteria bacterium]
MSTPPLLSQEAGVSERLSSIPHLIGNTPLLRIDRLASHLPDVEVFAKAEWFNPGGSVKDRAALRMLRRGEELGELTPGKTILEATSGNTGIALAMLGAALGYAVKLCVPATASRERRLILRAYGAELVETSALEGTDGAIREARRIHASDPDSYFYPDQYANDANWQAHYRGTANEIWEQTEGRITHFVCGLGTSGTFVGATRRLKELSPDVRCISVEPDGPFHGIEGWKHMASSLVPGIYDPTLADERLFVSTEDAYETARRLAREEGLFVSVSSAAALTAALRVAERARGGVAVTVFPDSGTRSLSEGPFLDDPLA